MKDCTRSHPHELMDEECEVKTTIARLTFRLALATKERDALTKQTDCRSGEEMCHLFEEAGYPCYRHLQAEYDALALQLAQMREELEWYGHEIAGGAPMIGYQTVAKSAENRWYDTTLKLLSSLPARDIRAEIRAEAYEECAEIAEKVKAPCGSTADACYNGGVNEVIKAILAARPGKDG